ncbi:MAG: hypothetical protein IT181_26725 [Acidobacteria bacterium]|nr:hypothetical protein [Acidobacteriota bacterium]
MRPLALALAWLGLVALPGEAFACFCPSTCVPRAGVAVFEATITAIGPSPDSALGIQQVLSLADVVVLAGEAPRALVSGASTCGYPFRVGVRYRIEAAETGARVVWASQCGSTRPLWAWSLRALPTMFDWWWRSGRACRS